MPERRKKTIMNEEKRNTAGQKWRKAVRFVLFWAVFAVLLLGAMFVLNKHHEKELDPELLHHGEELQVLFSGSSHIFNSVSPMELWNAFGITSYNIASGGETMPVSYWHLRNLLDYTDPQVVVLDLYGTFFSGKVFINGNPRVWMNSLPLTRNKVEAAMDLYGADGIEILFPFVYEHTRWNDLEPADMSPTQPDPLRGFERSDAVTSQPGCLPARDLGAGASNELGLEYLQKILDLCAENGIQLVPVVIPYRTTQDPNVEQAVNDALALVERSGIEPLDLRLYDVVDPETDFYNGEHLNISGAEKVTRWLGGWLQREAGVEDLREKDPALTGKWNGQYDAYRRLKRSGLEESVGLDRMLVRLRDADYSCILNIPPDLYLWTDDSYAYMRALLENLGIELTGRENETGLYAVVDSRNGVFTAQYGPQPVQTDWGLVEWQDRSAGTDKDAPLFRIDGFDYAFYGDYVDYPRAASVLIVENVTGNIISQRIYDLPGNF